MRTTMIVSSLKRPKNQDITHGIAADGDDGRVGLEAAADVAQDQDGLLEKHKRGSKVSGCRGGRAVGCARAERGTTQVQLIARRRLPRRL